MEKTIKTKTMPGMMMGESALPVTVRTLPKKGRGVFAARPFRKGEVILRIRGKVITLAQAECCSRYQQDHMYTLGKDRYMVAGYPDKYINHSCSPNVYEKGMTIRAMRGIRQGEELCFHYALNVLESFRMKCHCGSRGCKGFMIAPFFRLSKKEQRKLAPYLDDWFRREFGEELKNLEE
ncbi:TPA: SET domain-containing protein [Candidatus Woesearchaeota archaeon]|nr:SET domain-containing protein [Candidatus Woesearchaeota archaeon]